MGQGADGGDDEATAKVGVGAQGGGLDAGDRGVTEQVDSVGDQGGGYVIVKTVQEMPSNATHWSRSAMAEAVGISPSSVGRLWAEAGLKPLLTRGFKVSKDPMFEGKVTEIVGHYLDPPEHTVVLCVDEKS